MSTTESGRRAEDIAALYIESVGLKIEARNWRTRWHEVDIIASSPQSIHFIEVKYRANPVYGSGFDYISRDKALRLQRAALNWIQMKNYSGDYQIDVVSVSGNLDNPKIELISNAIEG